MSKKTAAVAFWTRHTRTTPISKIKSEVFNEVYSTFYGNENYEVIEEIDVINDYEDYGKVFTIKYIDKNYKDVYAIYKLEIVKEYIEQ
jgi:aspartyl/asparaginyl-tRNA synthetase